MSASHSLTERRGANARDCYLCTGYYEPSDDDIGSSEGDEEPHEDLQQGSAQSMVCVGRPTLAHTGHQYHSNRHMRAQTTRSAPSLSLQSEGQEHGAVLRQKSDTDIHPMDAHGRSSEECAISSTNKRGQRRQLVRSGSGSSSISSRGADSEGALPTTSQRGKGRVASGLFSSMRSAGRSVRASLGMPSSRRGTSESSAAASDDARGGKDARGRSASGEELAVAKDEVLQQYMVQARSLLRTLDDACGEAAAWEASALTAVAATETCHKMMEARLIVSRGKDELAKLGIVRSAFEKYTSVATSASLDSLRSLSALAGAARAGIMRVLSLAGCQRADAGDKQIQSYRKAAANCISEASQALDDLNTQLVRFL